MLLYESVEQSNLNSNVTISVLDERYSKDPSENNFAQIVDTNFYKRAEEQGCEFIDTRVSNNESQDDLADRFNKALVKWFKNNPNGTVIATVGIGPDGHTSGIMPYPEDPGEFERLFESNDLFVTSYDASGKNPYPARVTTNIHLLRKIDIALIYATGENKREALKRLGNDSGTLSETPARILRDIKHAYLFTDQPLG